MIQFTGVNHIAMATRNMDETIRFWRDLLGMRLLAGLGQPGYRQYFLEISDRDMIAFFEWPGIEAMPEKEHGRPVSGPFMFDHVSFGVGTENDLWMLKDRITAADIWVSEVIDHGFIHSIYSFDPNNIPIEFSYAIKDIDPRIHPILSDRVPVQTALEGFEPRYDRWPAILQATTLKERKIYPGAGSELFHGKK